MTEEKEKSVGDMKKRRVMMADGKRYLIYYTFGDLEPNAIENGLTVEKTEETEDV